VFLLGAAATILIEMFVEPFIGPMRIWWSNLLAPVQVDFVARADVTCEAGDVGAVIAAAEGDLQTAETLPERLARRAHLCHEFAAMRASPLYVLGQLGRVYPLCFSFKEYAARAGGGRVKPSFSIRLGERSQVCVAPVGKNPDTNLWEVKESLEQGRALCIPERDLSGPRWNQMADVRLCAAADLTIHGFDSRLLDDLRYEQAVDKLSR
jgi:hypothetical protein